MKSINWIGSNRGI